MTKSGKHIIVAVTGASGAIYARKTVSALAASGEVDEIALIVSANGKDVARFEGEEFWTRGRFAENPKIRIFDNNDMFSPTASGSSDYDAMIIVPCTVGCAGRIANGVSADLIGRSADVILKERRRLIMVVRETPLSTVHLRNLTTLSECGAVVVPASPSFYALPDGIESLCDSVVERVISLAGIESLRYRWSER